jgi:hypothetical protein
MKLSFFVLQTLFLLVLLRHVETGNRIVRFSKDFCDEFIETIPERIRDECTERIQEELDEMTVRGWSLLRHVVQRAVPENLRSRTVQLIEVLENAYGRYRRGENTEIAMLDALSGSFFPVMNELETLRLKILDFIPQSLLSLYILEKTRLGNKKRSDIPDLEMKSYVYLERGLFEGNSNEISYYFYNRPNTKKVMLWTNGKGMMVEHYKTREFLQMLSDKMDVSVLAWNLPGHGASSQLDITTMKTLDSALDQGIHEMMFLLRRMNYNWQDIIL